MMYTVCWQHSVTGKTDKGKPVSKTVAKAWVKKLNKEYPDILHWIEPA